ncbi:hypothetical protein KGM_215112B, partial [Danaus plexippus plexippus]
VSDSSSFQVTDRSQVEISGGAKVPYTCTPLSKEVALAEPEAKP